MKNGNSTAAMTERPYLHRRPRKYKLTEIQDTRNCNLSQKGTDYVPLAFCEKMMDKTGFKRFQRATIPNLFQNVGQEKLFK